MYALTVFPDCKEFEGRAPGILERSVIARRPRVPNNGLDLRLAILLRRISKVRVHNAELGFSWRVFMEIRQTYPLQWNRCCVIINIRP